MFQSWFTRPLFLRLNFALLLIAQTFGWGALRAAPPVNPPPPSPPFSLRAIRRGLREFDRFLDHHPLLEVQLRLNPALVEQPGPPAEAGLAEFLQANPAVRPGLRIYPRYFLNRALLREASAPISFAELVPLKEFFQREPEVEKKLIEDPELIRDPVFLNTHAAFTAFLRQRPKLAAVYLPPPVNQGLH